MAARPRHALALAALLAGLPATPAAAGQPAPRTAGQPAQPAVAQPAQPAAVASDQPAGPTGAAARPPRPLFAEEAPLRLALRADIAALPRARAEPEPSVPGELVVLGPVPETLAVRVAGRGKTRRSRDTCSFPPLRLTFATPPPPGSAFAGQRSLKLTTHCQASPRYPRHVLLEQAAYRLYNRLTPLSFRTRLAVIDYAGADGRPIASRPAFFIEDADDMARRNGLREIEQVGRFPASALDPPGAARFALFQDMIGNLDWAMNAGPEGTKCCHNSRPVGPRGATAGLVPVPFDFDYSGLVGAPYAVPPEQVKVASVRVRRYRGFCRHNEALASEAARMLARRDELLAVVRTQPLLEEDDREEALRYLAAFFERVASPAAVADRLARTCLQG